MSEPTLYVFPISHYCEKARRALETSGIAYRVRRIVLGLHRKKGKHSGRRV